MGAVRAASVERADHLQPHDGEAPSQLEERMADATVWVLGGGTFPLRPSLMQLEIDNQRRGLRKFPPAHGT